MHEKIEARVTHRFRASAERVYDGWLDPATVRRWMAASLRQSGLAGDIRTVEIDAREGGRFLFTDQRGDTEARHWGTYLELERPKRIVFTWIVDESGEADPSVVALDIVAESEGCTVTLVHRMDAEWIDYIDRVATSWGRMLAALDDL